MTVLDINMISEYNSHFYIVPENTCQNLKILYCENVTKPSSFCNHLKVEVLEIFLFTVYFLEWGSILLIIQQNFHAQEYY